MPLKANLIAFKHSVLSYLFTIGLFCALLTNVEPIFANTEKSESSFTAEASLSNNAQSKAKTWNPAQTQELLHQLTKLGKIQKITEFYWIMNSPFSNDSRSISVFTSSLHEVPYISYSANDICLELPSSQTYSYDQFIELLSFLLNNRSDNLINENKIKPPKPLKLSMDTSLISAESIYRKLENLRLAELDRFILKNKRLPMQKNRSKTEIKSWTKKALSLEAELSLGQWFKLYRQSHEDRLVNLSKQSVGIIENNNLLEQKLTTTEEYVQKLNIFISLNEKLPNEKSPDKDESYLGIWFNRFNVRVPEWTEKLTPDNYQILKQKGLLKRRKKTAKERYTELEISILKYQGKQAPNPKSSDKEESSLGLWFKTHRRRNPINWVQNISTSTLDLMIQNGFFLQKQFQRYFTPDGKAKSIDSSNIETPIQNKIIVAYSNIAAKNEVESIPAAKAVTKNLSLVDPLKITELEEFLKNERYQNLPDWRTTYKINNELTRWFHEFAQEFPKSWFNFLSHDVRSLVINNNLTIKKIKSDKDFLKDLNWALQLNSTYFQNSPLNRATDKKNHIQFTLNTQDVSLSHWFEYYQTKNPKWIYELDEETYISIRSNTDAHKSSGLRFIKCVDYFRCTNDR